VNHAQIRAFHAVACFGSFSKAAAALRVTQPTVSAQVKALEETHGVRLFHRRRAGVEPTAFGRRLLSLTRRLFDLEEEIVALLSGGRSLASGHLTVGTDSPACAAPLLAAFARSYPQLSLSLASGNADEMLAALLDYRTDVAIVAQRSDDPRVESLTLVRDSLVLFVHRAHPLSRRRTAPLAALAAHTLILREVGSITRALVEDALAAHGVRPRALMEIDSREAVHEAVAAGLGVGVVARSEVAHDPRLRTVDVADAELVMSEHLVCLRERGRLPVVRAFLELVRRLHVGAS
jgi:aminoethylphosphonate catabolism LysR family transcriptional regulator